jgi:glucoamylase
MAAEEPGGNPIALPPGWPGIEPRWTSSAKTGVGTSLGRQSRIWFTISHGIVNEVYYPTIDTACTRDLGLIVTDGQQFFSEEKRDARSTVQWIAAGVPGFRLSNMCLQSRYRIEKTVLSDPDGDVFLQRTQFVPLAGRLSDYRLYVLLAPHLGNRGAGNSGWIVDTDGSPIAVAQRDGKALALACSSPWKTLSLGYVGCSDGWQDLKAHRRLTAAYARADNGNIAITAELDLAATGGSFVIALGFGGSPEQAIDASRASLARGFDAVERKYVSGWRAWQDGLCPLRLDGADGTGLTAASAAVLATHESKSTPGGIIASLSIPWGDAKGDDDLGGYHLVWPRDLVETAGGLIAAGAASDAKRVLEFLRATQSPDGHWNQNMWIDGRPYWDNVQLDESALPILLVDMARREGVITAAECQALWPMVFKAARFVAITGPVTMQDRWEEDPGYSPFTLAASVASLLAAADLADGSGEPTAAAYFREVADYWNASIERWCYTEGTDLCDQAGAAGYYVRIAPPDRATGPSPAMGYVPIKNRPPGQSDEPAAEIVSTDALALVRFGLRRPDDPRVLDTVKVIDSLLRVDLPRGTAWHRYNDDGYGEQADGSAFDGTGIGRAWPLLAGERAHYELAAGRLAEAVRLLHAVEGFAGAPGLVSEQVWDSDDIPDEELFRGRPSHSAMPLVWAHAEYLKLRRSLRDGRVFDMPPQTAARYRQGAGYRCHLWRFNAKCRTVPQGKTLRLEALSPATVRWTADDWRTVTDTVTRDTGLGIHTVELATDHLDVGSAVTFTFHWSEADRWEGANFSVTVRPPV